MRGISEADWEEADWWWARRCDRLAERHHRLVRTSPAFRGRSVGLSRNDRREMLQIKENSSKPNFPLICPSSLD